MQVLVGMAMVGQFELLPVARFDQKYRKSFIRIINMYYICLSQPFHMKRGVFIQCPVFSAEDMLVYVH